MERPVDCNEQGQCFVGGSQPMQVGGSLDPYAHVTIPDYPSDSPQRFLKFNQYGRGVNTRRSQPVAATTDTPLVLTALANSRQQVKKIKKIPAVKNPKPTAKPKKCHCGVKKAKPKPKPKKCTCKSTKKQNGGKRK